MENNVLLALLLCPGGRGSRTMMEQRETIRTGEVIKTSLSKTVFLASASFDPERDLGGAGRCPGTPVKEKLRIDTALGMGLRRQLDFPG